MNYLLYCILNSSDHQMSQIPLGVGGQPVSLIADNGLSAAVSQISQPDLNPGITEIRAYGKVVEAYNSKRTVIPMRYGCWFKEKSDIIRLLEERHREYEILIEKFIDSVEMGVRIIIPGADCESSGTEILQSLSPTAGRAYLEARKTHYTEKESSVRENSALIERYRAVFSGLFIQSKWDISPFRGSFGAINNQLLSLYFLVPSRSLESFRQAFRLMRNQDSARFLLSGPWPPYNFVIPDPKGSQDSLKNLVPRS